MPKRYTYEYPRPALTVDCVVFGLQADVLSVLLIERADEPFAGSWAIPGGFVEIDEPLEAAAARELQEETGLTGRELQQAHTFGAVDRDPRGRTVSVAYWTLVARARCRVRAASDARNAAWFRLDELPRLAFDHNEVLAVVRRRLQQQAHLQPIGLAALPQAFTMRQLRQLYEAVWNRPLDHRVFTRKIRSTGLLVEREPVSSERARGAERQFRFDRRRYGQLSRQGFCLPL